MQDPASSRTDEDVHVATSSAEEEDVPLFATCVPAGGLTPGLQAIAALIDEEDAGAGDESARLCASQKRKAASLGTVQVHLALATFEQPLERAGGRELGDTVRGNAAEDGEPGGVSSGGEAEDLTVAGDNGLEKRSRRMRIGSNAKD